MEGNQEYVTITEINRVIGNDASMLVLNQFFNCADKIFSSNDRQNSHMSEQPALINSDRSKARIPTGKKMTGLSIGSLNSTQTTQ